MRHLDDGQIAELIDEAGRQAGGPADRSVELHLAECAACRERVEEGRQIAERARAILATAVPPVSAAAPMPPFEEVVHRAGRAGRRGVFRLRPLAWAATVVLAAGLGWFARGELVSPGRAAAPTVAQAPAELAAADAAIERPVPPEAVTNDRVGQEAGAQAAAPASAAAPPPAADTRLARSRGRVDIVRPTREETGKAAAAEPLPPARSDEAQRLAIRQPAPAPAEQAPVAGAELRFRRQLAEEDQRVVVSGDVVERVLGGRAAAVPGLELDAYYQLPSAPDVIHSRQRLPGGGMLELEQRRAAPAPIAGLVAPRAERARLAPPLAPVAEAPTGARAALDSMRVMSVDTVEVEGLRIVVRAPIPPDSLRALARRIRR
jgi:hypothetical protein